MCSRGHGACMGHVHTWQGACVHVLWAVCTQTARGTWAHAAYMCAHSLIFQAICNVLGTGGLCNMHIQQALCAQMAQAMLCVAFGLSMTHFLLATFPKLLAAHSIIFYAYNHFFVFSICCVVKIVTQIQHPYHFVMKISCVCF